MTIHARAGQLAGGARTGAAPTPAVMTLAIENMHCGGCLRSVERAVLKVPGVETARASLSAKRVSIAYDPALFAGQDVMKVAPLLTVGIGLALRRLGDKK